MAVVALATLSVTRPGGSAVAADALSGLVVSVASDAVAGGAVVAGGVAWATAEAGLASWEVSAEGWSEAGSAFRSAVLGAQRAGETVTVTAGTGDGVVYEGEALVGSASRSGEPSAAAGLALVLVGSGPLEAADDLALFTEGDTEGGHYDRATAHEVGPAPGRVVVVCDAYPDYPDTFALVYDGATVATTGPMTGVARLTYDYAPGPGDPTEVSVVVTAYSPPDFGNNWEYTVYFKPS